MQHRSRVVAGLVLACSFVLAQLVVAPWSPGTTASAACLLCPTTPTPTPTATSTKKPKPTPSLTASATATDSATATASASPTLTPSSTPTGTPTADGVINGPDVASYQHPATPAYPHGKPINWNTVRSDGMEFAIVKATESTTYKNPFFDDDYDGALAAGMVHGAYHFARPAYPIASTATAQAAYFVKQLGDVNTPATLPPVLDLEVTGGLPRADLVTWTQFFLYRVRALTGRTPMLYTYPSFWSDVLNDPGAFSRFPLWMASYCKPVPGCSPSQVDLWQYTSSSSIAGISGGVDQSRFQGTRALPWTTLSDGTVTAPWKRAAPKPPHNVTAVGGPATATVSWIPGNDGSARTTSYTVTSSPGGITAKVNGDSNTATVNGLDPATTYTFTVTATSAAGTSEPSGATGPITPVVDTELAPVQPSEIDYGGKLLVTAILTRADTHAPVPAQPITVMRKAPHATVWKTVGTETTDSDGEISVTLKPTRAVQVKLSYDGEDGYQAASTVGKTRVHALVTAALSKTTVKHGKFVLLKGVVTPPFDAEQVTLQYLVNGTWVTMRSKSITPQGAFTFKLHAQKKKPKHPITISYRAIVHPGHGLSVGASPPATLRIK